MAGSRDYRDDHQSERFPLYDDLCNSPIERGGAYVCTRENEHFKALKDKKTACPCRDQPVETALSLWEKMLDGGFKEGEASVRVKTDLLHPDPAMRDYPIFRILDAPSSESGRCPGLPLNELLGRC